VGNPVVGKKICRQRSPRRANPLKGKSAVAGPEKHLATENIDGPGNVHIGLDGYKNEIAIGSQETGLQALEVGIRGGKKNKLRVPVKGDFEPESEECGFRHRLEGKCSGPEPPGP